MKLFKAGFAGAFLLSNLWHFVRADSDEDLDELDDDSAAAVKGDAGAPEGATVLTDATFKPAMEKGTPIFVKF
eukprot:CAMPEP_0179004762 /NCGR_PEP_ID=MMETSP0795-20121207/13501_1 /TAXON_ID=88552 /ORGANISM="Amoebophrya sp., Strain Ameob2" /LENGTH=72 /DNA_ID=CAMNT_0020699093 /DNA_START=119 /DNA_END=334 /DNA_ORIENTATION=-